MTVGGACAVLTTVGFIVGVALMASAGVDTLIPEADGKAVEWLADVEADRDLFVAGAWIVVFAGLLGLLALVAFYDALRLAGPLMILAPVAGAVGLTLVTISHALPIALAYELAPDYLAADEPGRATLATTADTFAMVCLVLNYTGNALGWGLSVPLYAAAVLTTGTLPKWIGWLGMVVAVFAGWLGLLSPASDVIEGITGIGFLAFFIWMASMGVALLLHQRRIAAAPAP